MEHAYLNNSFRLYTVSNLQTILKISRSFAYKLVNSGELKCVRIHKLVRISPWALEEYMKSLSPEEALVQMDVVKAYFCDSIQYYTIQELQEILQIGDSFTRQLLRDRELKVKRIRQETRISSDSLFQFISSHEHSL